MSRRIHRLVNYKINFTSIKKTEGRGIHTDGSHQVPQVLTDGLMMDASLKHLAISI